MLFGRREKASWGERVRIALWPRRSFARSGKYVVKRVLRLTSSPHSIAAGVAAGVYASFTPFLGFHVLLAFALAYAVAGNAVAAMLGTFFGNPLTYPVIWAATYAAGRFILSGSMPDLRGEEHWRLSELSPGEILDGGPAEIAQRLAGLWEPILKPMAVGSIPLGIAFGIAAYLVTRAVAIRVRNVRSRRMARTRVEQGEAAFPAPGPAANAPHRSPERHRGDVEPMVPAEAEERLSGHESRQEFGMSAPPKA